MTSYDADVLIVGAGPTGLLLAGDLAARGVATTVLEKRAEESNLSRAFVVHARTLELLDARGLADDLLAVGHRVDSMVLFERGSIRLNRLPGRFPYLLATPQYNVERVLQRRAREQGAEIRTGVEVVGLDQDADQVRVRVRNRDGVEQTVTARYLLGADGVHSTVRRLLHIPFLGKSVLRSVMLADVRLDRPPTQRLAVNGVTAGLAFLAEFGDGWYRVIAWNRYHEADQHELVELAELREITRLALGSDYGMHDPRGTSRFHNDERQAPRYRVGRVLLVGDAAHAHSPAGGMGMNTSLQDAANLSWKLAAVLRGWAPDSVLDTYQAERYPVDRGVLRLSGTFLRLAILKSGLLRGIRGVLGRILDRADVLNDAVAQRLSGIGISYPAERGAHPLAGKRVPDIPLAGPPGRLYEALRSGRFLLLCKDEPAELAGWSDRVDLAVPAGGPDRTVLVRPDGYVAWASDERDQSIRDGALRAALTRWCGAQRSSLSSP